MSTEIKHAKSRLRARIRSLRGRTYSTTAPAETGVAAALHSEDGSVIIELGYNRDGAPVVTIQCSPTAHILVTENIFYGTLEEFKNRLKGSGVSNA